MITRLAAVTVYVDDQDEALRFYVDQLGFTKRDDIAFPNGFRWLSVGVPGQDVAIMLEQVQHSDRALSLPKAVGGNSTWVLFVDDCRKTTARIKSNGVTITGEPTEQPYGVEATIEDLYGNSYAIVEPSGH